MLVVSEKPPSLSERNGGQGTGLRIGREEMSDKEDSQGSIWGLSSAGG
jgi:hypothetical protein